MNRRQMVSIDSCNIPASIIVIIAAAQLPPGLGVLMLGLSCIVQLPLAIPWRWLGVADRNTG